MSTLTKIVAYVIVILLYMCVGGFFCGLLDEKDHPILISITWPFILVLGLALAFIKDAMKIGSKLREKVKK